MNGYCKEYERFFGGRDHEGEHVARRREHLRVCASCRRQDSADTALREAFVVAPPALSPGFEARLQQQLDRGPSSAERARRGPGGLRLSWVSFLVAYITGATFASFLILSRIPWQSLVVPQAMLVILGVLVMASPLVLFAADGVRS